MSTEDQYDTALCVYREARGDGYRGMTAVACVIANRVHKRGSSFSVEVFRPLQFSSMTAPHDPQLHTYPLPGDPQWAEAQDIAADAVEGNLADITLGSTLYYDISISFPASWNRAKCVPTVVIGRLKFFRELP